MEVNKLVELLRKVKIETGSMACLGCGYEHNCSLHGCAILREAADQLERQAKEERERRLVQKSCYQCNSKDPRALNGMRTLQYKFCPICGRALWKPKKGDEV